MSSTKNHAVSHWQPRPIKKPYYKGASGHTLDLSKLENPLPAVFHYPGHENLEGLQVCEVTIYSRSAGTFFRTFDLSRAADAPPSDHELPVPHNLFATEASIRYVLNYEFKDGTKLQLEDESDTYQVIRK